MSDDFIAWKDRFMTPAWRHYLGIALKDAGPSNLRKIKPGRCPSGSHSRCVGTVVILVDLGELFHDDDVFTRVLYNPRLRLG